MKRTRVSDRTETVGALKRLMAGFVRERKWEKFHSPRNLAASISIEAAELLEHFQWLTAEEAQKKSMADGDFRREVGEEMADVLLYILSLANVLRMDMARTVHEKMAKNRVKYPAGKFQGHYYRPVKKGK
jgi:NTP pyrophosphatase (non-canonical NTP hydrolase)